MNEPESSKASGPPRTHGMREIRAESSHLNRQLLLPVERFIYSETISGGLLLVCAIVALAWANSQWSQSYFALRDTPVSFQIGTFSVALDLQHQRRVDGHFLFRCGGTRSRFGGTVIPANAGIQVGSWIPAFAEMTIPSSRTLCERPIEP